jgi:hypothetical protein
VADPYYNYTSLLLHMDGANTSTNFVDSGPSALTVTRTGTPAISTAQSKYGGSSVAFSGSTDRLGVASNALFAFGTGDFTVEFWVYFNSISTSFVQLYDTYVTGGFSFYWSGSASTLIISNRSANQIVQAWSPSANTWYHLAVSRSGTSLRLFINGTVLGSTTASTSYVQGALQIGGTADNTSYSLNGYLDDLRITKYARYTSAFTPPAAALPDIYNPNTTLPVSGAALWLNASQPNTLFTDAGFSAVTTSGQSIYQWNDLSGNSRHATQATSGNRPTWVPPASGINGLGVVATNGTNQFFAISNTASWSLVYSGDFTINIIHKVLSASGGALFARDNGPGIVPKWILGYGSNGVVGAGFLGLHYNGGGSNVMVRVSWTPTVGQSYRITATRSGNDHYFFVNGSLIGTTQTTASRPGNSTVLATVSQAENLCWMSGQIGELIAHESYLNSSGQAQMSSYSLSKWGIA